MCKNRLVDKLVEHSSAEECTKNIDETRLVEINSQESKHNSCTLYTALFSILFTVNIGIGNSFLCCYWYLKKKMLFVLSLVPALKQHFNELINRKSQRNGDKKLNLLFLQRQLILKNLIQTY